MLSLWLMTQGGPVPQQAAPPPDQVDVLAMDLRGGSRPERKYAARELLRQTRLSLRTLDRMPSDSLESLEARQTLGELEREAVPACLTQLAEPATLRPCSELLVLMESQAAIPVLVQAQEQDTLSRRHLRVLARAESALRELQ